MTGPAAPGSGRISAVTETPLAPLRVERRPLNLTRILSTVSERVALVDGQREPWARYWDRRNARNLEGDGPLWVALGDSTSQGLGARHPDRGFVPEVLRRLRTEHRPDWRLVNLSMTGARIHHVVGDQLNAMRRSGLRPDLVTCLIGVNDMIAGSTRRRISRDTARLVAALPEGTVTGTLLERHPWRVRKATLNSILRDAADRGHLRLFDPWKWTATDDALAVDRFHPGDGGYRQMAMALDAAVRSRLES